MTGATSYRTAWDKSVGESSSWIPASACTFKTGVANVAYSMILADTFKALARSAGYDFTRTNVLLGITVSILFPLCMMKDLASLAPFSLLGIAGMGFTALAMGIRCFGGDYALPAGRFLADIPASSQPFFGDMGMKAAASPKTFILLSMLSTAYLAHYNAPKYYMELKDNTIKRYNTVVGTAFTVAIAIFTAITALGFLTFGANSQGFILNNYSTKDSLATMCRIAIAVSIVFSYPLAFVGLREGMFDLLNVSVKDRAGRAADIMSVKCLGVVTLIATMLTDLSFVLSFGGATLGNAIVFGFPALMFRAVVRNQGLEGRFGGEAKLCKALLWAGIGMGGIGAFQALKAQGLF